MVSFRPSEQWLPREHQLRHPARNAGMEAGSCFIPTLWVRFGLLSLKENFDFQQSPGPTPRTYGSNRHSVIDGLHNCNVDEGPGMGSVSAF